MPVFRSSAPVKPIVWGNVVLTPHRENAPRRQCTGGCAGGGEINGVRCRECQGLGYFDAQHPPRSSTSETDAY